LRGKGAGDLVATLAAMAPRVALLGYHDGLGSHPAHHVGPFPFVVEARDASRQRIEFQAGLFCSIHSYRAAEFGVNRKSSRSFIRSVSGLFRQNLAHIPA
jgi:hypothetical protein